MSFIKSNSMFDKVGSDDFGDGGPPPYGPGEPVRPDVIDSLWGLDNSSLNALRVILENSAEIWLYANEQRMDQYSIGEGSGGHQDQSLGGEEFFQTFAPDEGHYEEDEVWNLDSGKRERSNQTATEEVSRTYQSFDDEYGSGPSDDEGGDVVSSQSFYDIFLEKLEDSSVLYDKNVDAVSVYASGTLFAKEYIQSGKMSAKDSIDSSLFFELILNSKTNMESRLALFERYHDNLEDYIDWISRSSYKVFTQTDDVTYEEDEPDEEADELQPEDAAHGLASEQIDSSNLVFDSEQLDNISNILSTYGEDEETFKILKAEVLRVHDVISGLYSQDIDDAQLKQATFNEVLNSSGLNNSDLKRDVLRIIFNSFGAKRFALLEQSDISYNIDAVHSKHVGENVDIPTIGIQDSKDKMEEINEEVLEGYEDEDVVDDSIDVGNIIEERRASLIKILTSQPAPIMSKETADGMLADEFLNDLADREDVSSLEVLGQIIISLHDHTSDTSSDGVLLAQKSLNYLLSKDMSEVGRPVKLFILNLVNRYIKDHFLKSEPSSIFNKIESIYNYLVFERSAVGRSVVDGPNDGISFEEDEGSEVEVGVLIDDDANKHKPHDGLVGVYNNSEAKKLKREKKLLINNGPGGSRHLSETIRIMQKSGSLPGNSTFREISRAFNDRGEVFNIGEDYFSNLFFSLNKRMDSTDIEKRVIDRIKHSSSTIHSYLYIDNDQLVVDEDKFSAFMRGCTVALMNITEDFGNDKDSAVREVNCLIAGMKILEENNLKLVISKEGISRAKAIDWLFKNNISISKSVTAGSLTGKSYDQGSQLLGKSDFSVQLFWFFATLQNAHEMFALRDRGSQQTQSALSNKMLQGIAESSIAGGSQTNIERFISKLMAEQVKKIDQLFSINVSEGSRDGVLGVISNWDGARYRDDGVRNNIEWENDLSVALTRSDILKRNFISRLIKESPGYCKVKCPMCAKDKLIRFSIGQKERLEDIIKRDKDRRLQYFDDFRLPTFSPFKNNGEVISEEELLAGTTGDDGSNISKGLWKPPPNLRQAEYVYYNINDENNWKTIDEIREMIDKGSGDTKVDGQRRMAHINQLISYTDSNLTEGQIEDRLAQGVNEVGQWPPPNDYSKKVVSEAEFDFENIDTWKSWDDINDLIGSNDQNKAEEGLLRRAEVYRQLGAMPITRVESIKDDAGRSKQMSLDSVRLDDKMFKCPFDSMSAEGCGITYEVPSGMSTVSSDTIGLLQPSSGGAINDVVRYEVEIKKAEFSIVDGSFDDFLKNHNVSMEQVKALNPGWSDENLIFIPPLIVWHESIYDAVSRGIEKINSSNGKYSISNTISKELIYIKNYGINSEKLKDVSDKDYLNNIVKSNHSSKVIELLDDIGRDDIYMLNGRDISYFENHMSDDKVWADDVTKDRYERFSKNKSGGGYKFSRTLFPCPCHIENPDISMVDKYTTMAMPHAGPFKMWELRDDWSDDSLVSYSAPTDKDGNSKINDIKFGQLIYLICGAPTSISRFSRDSNPTNKNTMMSILREYGREVSDELVGKWGIDIEDIRPILNYIDESKKGVAGDDDVGGETESSIDDSYYLDKISEVMNSSDRYKNISNLFSIAMAKSLGSTFEDKILNLELICPYGHKFTIKQSLDFGSTHFGYHLLGRSLNRDGKSTSYFEKYMNVLSTTGVDNLKEALDRTKLFRNLKNTIYIDGDSGSKKRKIYSTFESYLYSEDDSKRGKLSLMGRTSSGSPSKKKIKKSFFMSLKDMSEAEIESRLSSIYGKDNIPDGAIDMLSGLAGNYTFGSDSKDFRAYIIEGDSVYDSAQAQRHYEFIEGLEINYSTTGLDDQFGGADGEGRSWEESLDSEDSAGWMSTGSSKELSGFMPKHLESIGDSHTIDSFVSRLASFGGIEEVGKEKFYEISTSQIGGQGDDLYNGMIPDQFNIFIRALKMYVRIINLYLDQTSDFAITSFITGGKEQVGILRGSGKGIPDADSMYSAIKSLISGLIKSDHLEFSDGGTLENIARYVTEESYSKLSKKTEDGYVLDLNYPMYHAGQPSRDLRIRTSASNLINDVITSGIISGLSLYQEDVVPKGISTNSIFNNIESKYSDFIIFLKEQILAFISDNEGREPSIDIFADIFSEGFLDMIEFEWMSGGSSSDYKAVASFIENYVINNDGGSSFNAADIYATLKDSEKAPLLALTDAMSYMSPIFKDIESQLLDQGLVKRKISRVRLQNAVRAHLNSDIEWIRLLSPDKKLKLKDNSFVIKDEKRTDSSTESSRNVSSSAWNKNSGSFMDLNEDVRSIISSKMFMSYCLYLSDCIKPIINMYLEEGGPKYIGYKIDLINSLKDYESLFSITEDMLLEIPDSFSSLSDSEKDSIVSSCYNYIKNDMDWDGRRILTPFAEAYALLSELMSNPIPLMSNGYMEQASKRIREWIEEGKKAGSIRDLPGGTNFFENPMYEYFFDRSTVFKTDELSSDLSMSLAPYPCIYRGGNYASQVRDITNMGLLPKARITKDTDSNGNVIVRDSVSNYDSSKSQWGKIGPSRSKEGMYPPPSGFNIFGGDVDILTSRGKVLDLFDDYGEDKKTRLQDHKSGLPSLVVPSAKVIISINNKNYDISFLVRRSAHKDIMQTRRRISVLLNDRRISINKSSEAETDSERLSYKKRISAIDSVIDNLYNQMRNIPIAVFTNLINKISTSNGKSHILRASDSAEFEAKSLPCITEVDVYTAYWLITNPLSAPHPYTSQEDQDNLLMYLFNSANLSPILSELETGGYIGRTTVRDLRPNKLYSIDIIADSLRLKEIKDKYGEALSLAVSEDHSKREAGGVEILMYREDPDKFSGEFSSLKSIGSEKFKGSEHLSDRRGDIIGKIHKMFSHDVISRVKGDDIEKLSSSDMSRFRGDYTGEEGASPGSYYDIVSRDDNDSISSSITYSMASLDINDLIGELLSFGRLLNISTEQKFRPKIDEMIETQKLLIRLKPLLSKHIIEKYLPSSDNLGKKIDDYKLELKRLKKEIEPLDANVRMINSRIHKLDRKSPERAIAIENRDKLRLSLKEKRADRDRIQFWLDTEEDKSDVVRYVEKRKILSSDRQRINFSGIWPGVWYSNFHTSLSRRKLKAKDRMGDSSILLKVAIDMINTIGGGGEGGSTIFEEYAERKGKELGREGMTARMDIYPNLATSDWISMLKELCIRNGIDPESQVNVPQHTRISDIHSSTKVSEWLRIFTEKAIVKNTHAVWNGEFTAVRSRDIEMVNVQRTSVNPYMAFNSIVERVRDDIASDLPSFPTVDKNTPINHINDIFKNVSKIIHPDKVLVLNEEKRGLADKLFVEFNGAHKRIVGLRSSSGDKFIGSIEKRSVKEELLRSIITVA